VLWFLLLFAERNNIDLEEALLKKLEKNEKRFPLEKYNGYWEKPSRE
jgi:NTP pyrophosphatase (non-canonical NTP hydrolase)